MSDLKSRREFVAGLCSSGAVLATGSWMAAIGHAQTRGPARAVLARFPYRADLDRRLLGAFLEHLGRAIYTGVYEPGLEAGRRHRLPQGRARRSQGAGRADHAVSRAATSSPATTGSTASAPRTSARPFWSGRGTRSRRTSSAPTSSSSGASSWARSRCWASTSARVRPSRRSPTSSTATSTTAPSGATCAASTATSSRTTCGTGAWATRWTAPGRWAT